MTSIILVTFAGVLSYVYTRMRDLEDKVKRLEADHRLVPIIEELTPAVRKSKHRAYAKKDV